MGLLSTLFGGNAPEAVIKEYREPQTGDLYRMKFFRSGNQWTIYAIDFPRDPHRKGVEVNHKYPDGRICVAAGVDVPTLSMAKAIGTHWMMGWSMYVRSRDGRWQRNGRVRVNVPD
jgi:hypothetical protein